MLIQADHQKFHLSLTRVSQNLRAWWKEHEHDADSLEIAEGKKIDFSKKSLARTALKTALAPVAIPCLRMLYATKGAKPRDFDRKNEDMFDYIVDVLLAFIAVLDDGYLYVETIERSGSDDRYIQSISTHAPVAAIDGAREENEEPNPQERARGQALVYRGQDRNGQDVFHQSPDPEET
jgi:hypothetical protein